MVREYPRSFAIRVAAVDAISLLIGLAVFATPFAAGFFPGAFDTTVHVALGALISVCAAFRVLHAFGSLWLEVVLAVFGVLVLLLPKFMHMMYQPTYNTGHLVAGGLLVLLSLVSGAMTAAQLRKM